MSARRAYSDDTLAFRARLAEQNRAKTAADLRKLKWVKAIPGYSPKLPAAELRALIAKHHRDDLQKKFAQGNLVTTLFPDQAIQSHIVSFLPSGAKSAYSKVSKKANEIVRVTDTLEKFLVYLLKWLDSPRRQSRWFDNGAVQYAFFTDKDKLIFVTLHKYGSENNVTIRVSSQAGPQEVTVEKTILKTNKADVYKLLRTVANVYRYCKGRTHRSTPIPKSRDTVPKPLKDQVDIILTPKTPAFPQMQRLLVRQRQTA